MIRARLDRGEVLIEADAEGALTVLRLHGATRTRQMPPLTWRMPLTLDTLAELKRERVPVTVELAARAQKMLGAQKYVERMKAADKVQPLRPVPIREGCTLYDHQIKAYNIALALFDYEEGEGSHDHADMETDS